MSNWKKYKLKDVTSKITKGTTPSTVGGKFLSYGINYIKSEAVDYNGRIDKSTFVYIDEETHNKLQRSQLQEEDILFSMAGAFLGKTGLVTKDMLPANTNQALAIIRVVKSLAVPKFIHFFLRMPETVRYVNSMSAQSAQPNVNLEEIGSLELELPPLKEQQAIAEILSSLDDKIEHNLQMNKTLEEMAMTLYKDWFVDFGPFKEGKFVESELGLIPEGWEVKSIYEAATFINGAAFKSKNFTSDGYPIIKIAELKQGISSQTNRTQNIIDEKYLIDNGDILFSWSGNPYTSIDVFIFDLGKSLLNQHIFKVVPRSENEKPFMFTLLKGFMPIFIQLATHKQTTGLGHITVANLKDTKFSKPNDVILDQYCQLVNPFYQLIFNNKIEINYLKTIRDTLLPKLISGEVRVKDLEKQVAQVL